MIANIVKTFNWQAMIDEGKFANVNEPARTIRRDKSYVSWVTRFTLLAPEIVHAVLNGKFKKGNQFGTLQTNLSVRPGRAEKII